MGGTDVHDYSSDASDRKIVPPILAVAGIGLALSLSVAARAVGITTPWWIDAPSVMGFYGFLRWGFDRWGWRRTIARWKVSAIPDISGTWRGEIASSFEGEKAIEATMWIRQSWTRIGIVVETASSRSESCMACLNEDEGHSGRLRYEYRNTPRPLTVATLNPHRGLVNLELGSDVESLAGEYFTDEKRFSSGRLSFRRVDHRVVVGLDSGSDRP
jgi:SMODS-associating 2TM, beta-strand rich effector domain